MVFGKRLSSAASMDAVAWGMVVAAVLIMPLGLWQAGTLLLGPSVLATGLAIAALSSALPYALEMRALRVLPARLFGMFLSAAPALAALAGYFILGEKLLAVQWLAIAMIMLAVAAGTLSASRS
ncbi:MAG: EamA family transporter [Janthinobacterium lividum]